MFYCYFIWAGTLTLVLWKISKHSNYWPISPAPHHLFYLSVCVSAHMWQSEDNLRESFLLLSCGSWRWNSGCQGFAIYSLSHLISFLISNSLIFVFIVLFHVYKFLPTYMYVYHIIVHARYPWKSEEGIQYPGPVVRDAWEPPCLHWELK